MKSAELPTGRRFVNDIRRAVRAGKLSKKFRAADVRRACAGWSPKAYSNVLPKHRVGNPGGNAELFVRHEDGSYGLAGEWAKSSGHRVSPCARGRTVADSVGGKKPHSFAEVARSGGA